MTDQILEVLKGIDSSLKSISQDLSNPMLQLLSFASIAVAAISAIYSRAAAREIANSRLEEMWPVVKNAMFTLDAKTNQIILRVQGKGKGHAFNVHIVEPEASRKLLSWDLAPDTDNGKDERIPAIGNGHIVLEYEDVAGNVYRSYGKVVDNPLEGSCEQAIIRKKRSPSALTMLWRRIRS